MGYKLAGCEVLGCCEIDKKMNEVYIKNHHPKYNYQMDIREFNKLELPKELYNLDILDGSPPCTTFSMAGSREESWGKKKKFKEGQVEQTLDDLLFVFIDTVAKLKPKVAIMENVEGLLLGEAWKYVQQVYKKFDDIGYDVQHYLLKGENMGVPQKRHRVFFIAVRKSLKFDFDTLNMHFDYEPITYGMIKGQGDEWSERAKQGKLYKLFCKALPYEKALNEVSMRLTGKDTYWQSKIIHDNEVMPTIRASHSFDGFRYSDKKKTTISDIINSTTFPQDYDFINNTISNVTYICGMSVPPIMIKRIATRLIQTGIFKENNNGNSV